MLGIIAFIVVLLAYVTPVASTVFGFIVAAPDPTGLITDQGWAWVSGLFWAFIGIVIAGVVAFIGLVLGIASLFVKFAGRVLSIIAIVLGALPVLVLLLILALGGLSAVSQ